MKEMQKSLKTELVSAIGITSVSIGILMVRVIIVQIIVGIIYCVLQKLVSVPAVSDKV